MKQIIITREQLVELMDQQTSIFVSSDDMEHVEEIEGLIYVGRISNREGLTYVFVKQ